VVVLKAGRKGRATGRADPLGAIVGSDDVFDAACAAPVWCGCAQFTAAVLGRQVPGLALPPGGPRLAIVTNGGGPGVLAADWAARST
jgi:acetyltransferase